jgi:flagella basal body P-ring formation protein FlgA
MNRTLFAALALVIGAPVAAEVVATRALPRGTLLAADDLAGPPDAVAELVGQHLTRGVAAGVAVRAVRGIRRGDPVALMAGRGGVSVGGRAVALEDAALGHPVRVRAASGTVLAGVALPGGRVRIDF